MKDVFEPYWSLYLDKYNYPNEWFKIPKNTNKYCVIVEPRKSPFLEKVIKNFMALLQFKNWGLILFHGSENGDYIKDKLKNIDNINYINLNVVNLNNTTYNNLLVSNLFWQILINKFKCEHCLIFQIDTLLLKNNIDDFLKYDYVGAPWSIKFKGVLEVGNGGLSLRNTRKMLYICENVKYNGYDNEDIYFSLACIQLKLNVPSKEEAKKFSIESLFYEDPMGLHNPHVQHFKEKYIELMKKAIDN